MLASVIVTETAGVARIAEPVRVGVPIPRGELPGAVAASLGGQPVQSEVLARWGDGSAKWVLLDLAATCAAHASTRIEVSLTGGADQPAAASPMRFDDGRMVFGLACARQFLGGLRAGASAAPLGLELHLATSDGRIHAPLAESVTVESTGPGRTVWRLRFRIPTGLAQPLLADVRISACPGFPALSIETTLTNPNASVRATMGLWPLGSQGAAYLRSFALRLIQPATTATTYACATENPWVSASRPIRIEQESSGGLHSDLRTHINRHGKVAHRYNGYRVLSGAEQLGAGFRADPFLEMQVGADRIGIGMQDFWQNFPVALDSSGVIEFLSSTYGDGEHELQGGEAKTWTSLISVLPLDAGDDARRRMHAACIAPLRVLPAVELVERSNAICPVTRRDDHRRPAVERAALAMIRDPRANVFTQREMIDEYGWRNYGDLWADNETGCTGAPRPMGKLISHYNQEYDWGFGMLLQALRNSGIDDAAASDFAGLAIAALRHEADIDTYHCWPLEAHAGGAYCGGHFTHSAHGVEAGDGTHRGGPSEAWWGTLDWPWGRGGGPESGHYHTRGQWLLYHLTGNRRHLDSALERTSSVELKIGTDQFSQMENADRCVGHSLQILLDAWQGTADDKFLRLAAKLVDQTRFARTHAEKLNQNPHIASFTHAIYLREYVRFLEALDDRGQRGTAVWQETLDSVMAFLDLVADTAVVSPEQGLADTYADGKRANPVKPTKDGWNLIPQNGWFADVFAQAALYAPEAARRDRYRKLARALCDLDQRISQGSCPTPIYRNAKVSTAFCRSGMVASALLGL